MTTFVKALVASEGYKESETLASGRVVLHFGAADAGDGMVECAEAVVADGYDADAVKSEYEAWAAGQEALRLAAAVKVKQNEVEAYDVSDAVNSFQLKHGENVISYWLPAAQRNQLVTSVTAWSNSHDTYRLDLREYGTYIDVSCNTLLAMLSKLEDYAVGCYNATSANLAAVAKLATVEDVEGFDVSTGYPEKLTFEV